MKKKEKKFNNIWIASKIMGRSLVQPAETDEDELKNALSLYKISLYIFSIGLNMVKKALHISANIEFYL